MWAQNLIALAIIAAAFWVAQRGKKKKLKSMPDNAGDRDAPVIVTFADGSTQESTWEEIEQKVENIKGEPWWIERKLNILLGSLIFLLGIAVELAIIYFQKT